ACLDAPPPARPSAAIIRTTTTVARIRPQAASGAPWNDRAPGCASLTRATLACLDSPPARLSFAAVAHATASPLPRSLRTLRPDRPVVAGCRASGPAHQVQTPPPPARRAAPPRPAAVGRPASAAARPCKRRPTGQAPIPAHTTSPPE